MATKEKDLKEGTVYRGCKEESEKLWLYLGYGVSEKLGKNVKGHHFIYLGKEEAVIPKDIIHIATEVALDKTCGRLEIVKGRKRLGGAVYSIPIHDNSVLCDLALIE